MTDFTIADVLAWARTKPADGRYNYGDIQNCALCQFLRETGRAKEPSVGGTFWDDEALPVFLRIAHDIPDPITTALISATFGGLVKALEKLCPDAPVTKSDWLRIDAYLTARVDA